VRRVAIAIAGALAPSVPAAARRFVAAHGAAIDPSHPTCVR